MEIQEGGQIDICHTVAVGEAEGLVVQKGFDPRESAAGHRVLTGIYDRHSPGFRLAMVNFHAVAGHVHGDIRHVQEIVRKVFLDQIPFVTGADDEIVDPLRRVNLENMPEDGLAAYFNHRLGL